jgi:1-acyl-sn-glycerol-3-phosphate acyltransferase
MDNLGYLPPLSRVKIPMSWRLRLQAATTALPMRLLAFTENALIHRFWDLHVYDRHFADEVAKCEHVLLVANHLTVADSWPIAAAICDLWFHDFTWLPWNLAERKVFMRSALGLGHLIFYVHRCIFVEREGDSTNRRRALEECTALLASGRKVLVFPEGTRSRTERMRPCKPGAAIMAKSVAGCMILPVYHRGMEEVLPVGSKNLKVGKRLDVYFSKPIDPNTYRTVEDLTMAIEHSLKTMERRVLGEEDVATVAR